MTLPLIGVGLSYVVLAVLLLSLNLASRWHWGIKAAAIAVTTVFFGVSYTSIAGLIAGTARDLDVPEAPADQDRRLAGTPPRQDEPGTPGDPTAFIQHMPSIEFQDMPPPTLPPKGPL